MKSLGEQLRETFSPKFMPTAEELDSFVQLSDFFEFTSKQELIQVNKSFDRVFYITDGMARSYVINKDKQYTVEFYTKGQFILDWDSFDQDTPSKYQFESIFPVSGYYWRRDDILGYLEKKPHLKKYRRYFAEIAYLRQADRLVAFQSDSLKDRYLNLVRNHGELINTAPQYHLASYLGVKPQSLSRIKTTLLNSKNGKVEIKE